MVYDSDGEIEGSGGLSRSRAGRRRGDTAGSPGGKPRSNGPNLSWEDMGYFGNAVAVASRQWRAAAKSVRDEYGLGPHGPWIIGLIASAQVIYPSDLTRVLRCGRSLISAELNKLSDAGLINTRKSSEDGRQIELTLTPLGLEVNVRIAESLSKMLEERLADYTREEVLSCANLLRTLAAGSSELS